MEKKTENNKNVCVSKQVKSYFTGGRIIFVQSNVKKNQKKPKGGKKNVFLISDNFFFKYFIQWSKKKLNKIEVQLIVFA